MQLNNLYTFLCGLILISSLLTACDRPECRNTHPIFDTYSPEDKEYKEELIKLLKKTDASTIRYWLKSYKGGSAGSSMLIYVQGHDLCALMEVDILQSQKGIESIVQKKGMGYSGAELKDVQYHFSSDSLSSSFQFESVSGIVD